MYQPSPASTELAQVVTDAHVDVIVRHMEKGGSEQGAVALARVSRDEWRNWRSTADNNEFFFRRLEEEREKLIEKNLDAIQLHAVKDWRAASRMLEVIAPERYGANGPGTLTITTGDPSLLDKAMKIVYGEVSDVKTTPKQLGNGL